MISTGLLTISGGISDLDGTTLAKAPLTGNPFGRATTFLRQDRGLNSGDFIWVDGSTTTIGNVSVMVITDAGPAPAPMMVGVAPAALTADAAGSAKAGGAEKGAAKKVGGKKVGATKKGAAKKGSAKKSSAAKKSSKKSAHK